MSALTTNNTLPNNEINKSIYDDFIAESRSMVSDGPSDHQVKEIAFMLNARHGLRLARRFGGMVSVELHTDTAHDMEAIASDGKIPVFGRCEKRLRQGSISPDTLLTLAGLASFTADQKMPDDRIRSITGL